MKRSCLILAAGMGSRLRPLTDDRPKGMVPLLGKPLLLHQIEVLESQGVSPIGVVTGYLADKINALGYPTFHNAQYDTTNMVESVFAARSFLESVSGDFLISYGDIVFQQDNLGTVLNTEGDIVVMVDARWIDLWSVRNEDPINDAETLKMTSDNHILELGKKPTSLDEIEGQYTGLIKIASHKIADFMAFYDALDRHQLYDGRPFEQMYMTSFLQLLIDAGWKVKAAIVNNGWLEVDTVADLHLYEQLEEKHQLAPLWREHV